ncbi:MAG: extracellular solute-binding protein [Chloroflexi bacterium]|nr:MAG: extracellular solute-binding protein [Chloroflexota bacterium]
MVRGTLTRRRFLAGCATAGGALAASACGWPAQGFGLAAPSGGVLTYWNLFGGGDGVRMVAMQDAFGRQRPDISLDATTLTWGNPYYTKLSMATLGGAPPDVAIMHLARMPQLAPAGLLRPLSDDELARHGMSAQDFAPNPWQQSHSNGRLYAIPLDTHPFTLYYNTDVGRKAGLLADDGSLLPLTSPGALLAAFDAARRVTGQFGLAISTANDPATPWRAFLTFYTQLGGEMLRDNGAGVVFDRAHALTVLEFLRELTIGRSLAPSNFDYGSTVALFASQGAGFYWEGEWEVTTFQTARIPFDMAPFPAVFGRAAIQADSHSFVIPRLEHDDPERLDRALIFIRSMLDQSQTWAEGGHIPAWRPTLDSAAYRALKPQAHYASAADSVVYDPPAWYSGSGSDFEVAMGSAIAAVMNGTLGPAAGADQMLAALERLAGTASPV